MEQKPMVINLSNYNLNDSERTIVKKGLKFCPTPVSNNLCQDITDRDSFCRSIKCKEYFNGRNMSCNSKVRAPSAWEPDNSEVSPEVNHFISMIESYPSSSKRNKIIHNVSLEERKAITSLRNNRDILIKKADKGSATVIMNRNYYRDKIMEMLSDVNTYNEIPNNIDKNIIAKIKTLAKKYKNILTHKETKFICNFEYKTSLFYGLPKVHKSEDIKQAIELQNSELISIECPSDLKFRPIVAGTQSPTHRLSHLLDVILQPYLKYIKSYTKDTVDFLNKLPDSMQNNYIFATFDVVSLYTNITHELGLKSLKYWLEKYPLESDKFSKEFILEAANLVLTNNSFEFDSKHYIQIKGTAMGTKMAPVYANLVLGYIEILLESKIMEEKSPEIANNIMKYYFRFLDDIFICWDNNIGDIRIMKEWLTSLNLPLSFSLDQSGSKVSFLDVDVEVKNNKVITDVHYKNTDSKRYLDFYSCHPRSTKNSVPYNLARRLCTIISERETLYARLNELEKFLSKCNYPANVINIGISKALNIPKSVLRDRKNNNKDDKNNRIPFISTHDPNRNSSFNFTKTVFQYLKENSKTKKVFGNISLINAKRQPPSLSKLITSARFDEKEKNVKKCNTNRCQLCEIIIEGPSFNFNNTIFTVNDAMDCNTLNCCYLLECNGCNKLYIGETSNLRLRINLHRDHCRKNAGLNVNKHMFQCASNCENPFKIKPFYKIYKDDQKFRRKQEYLFINKFKPELNR